MLPEFHFRSMRARMTVVCILFLAPFLFLTSKLLMSTVFQAEAQDDEKILMKAAYGVGAILKEYSESPGDAWRAPLTEWVQKFTSSKWPGARRQPGEIAFMVLEVPHERVLWRSQADLPWPIQNNPQWQAANIKTPPRYLIVAAWPRQFDFRALLYERWGLWGLNFLILVTVAAGAWFLVGRTLSPIRRLAHQAGTASTENLHLSLVPPSQDAEMVQLVGTLNSLLARIAETAAARGRFTAAASHELRTPLQALSGHIEVALSRPRTAEEYEAALQEAHRQTGRLTSLVRDLLLLHQFDSASSESDAKEPLDLVEVCTRILGQLEPLAEARGLQMETDFPQSMEMTAVPTHVEILVRNLVENALRYALEESPVTIRLTNASKGAMLEVFNECLLPVAEPHHLFEPFYRPDVARNRKTGGNGLGLAICRAVASVNGWEVTLQPEPTGVRAIALFTASNKLI